MGANKDKIGERHSGHPVRISSDDAIFLRFAHETPNKLVLVYGVLTFFLPPLYLEAQRREEIKLLTCLSNEESLLLYYSVIKKENFISYKRKLILF